ncbi:RTA1 like protein-domain-containing protein [Stachybotrys elegans]|uniref:RTA1 like protein-domain-containing protein n=1 Tax=Stachybotrys elegans TaxID=80388 RepID=A0A8K0SM92_9HYPO|nr:RTA1 like protein-domain-containing protein [Stachybotrys elegans]
MAYSVWMYDPSLALAVVGSISYGITFFAMTATTVQHRAWYFLVVVVGAAVEVVAYCIRAYATQNQSESGPFIATLVLTVLAPIFVAGGNYLLISRLIVAVLPENSHRILGIPGRRLTPIFVACDVIAFLVQGAGSGIASSNDWAGEGGKLGEDILMSGLAFQLAAFCLFLTIFGRFHFLATRMEVETAPHGWRRVVASVYVSSVLIMTRCVYRLVEFGQGTDEYAFNHEWLFWLFEALPMLGAIGIFCIYHPGRYLGKADRAVTCQDIADQDSATKSTPSTPHLTNRTRAKGESC